MYCQICPVDHAFRVPCLLSHMLDLYTQRQALVRVLRPPDGAIAPAQCVAQQRRITKLPGKIDRLLAQDIGTSSVRIAAQGTRQPGEQPYLPLAVDILEGAKRLFEQRNKLPVMACPSPHHAPAIAERSIGELMRILATPGAGRGVEERGPSRE